jgi:eukaryotic-like serine/threonine-protein kinase
MALTSGTKLGPYEIQSPLGAGGMGEVYRARDTRLDRIVAIKVLPASFSADPERLRRFGQEARSVAALNHPNILAVHDIGTHDSAPYMVCELLEGETLRERLQGGAISSKKAIEFATQIAQGLAAAHDKGIVHRDLKPENIFLTKDGRVKILDFGLAKVAHSASDANGVGQTLTSAPVSLTEAGHVLGTAGYMSPEQVRGANVDPRSDIFTFGAILFEMLSGQRAFRRDTSAETMTAILKEDPPELTETNRGISSALERIVRHCLEKNPDQRFQSARDLAFNLDALSQYSSSSVGAIAKPTAVQRVRRFQWLIALLLVAFAAGFGYLAGHSAKTSSEVTYHQLTFRKGTVLSARFAPDNRTIIYGAAWSGKDQELFSTRQDTIESRPVGLSQADLLGISSTGEIAISLKPTTLPGFFGVVGTLARTPLTGGTAPREFLENVEWADWSPDGSNLLIVRTVGNENRIEYPPGKVVFKVTVPAWISHPRISRDGKRIAFCQHVQRGDDRGSVTIINSDGGGKAKSFGDFASLYGLAWSPKDDEVWFTADPAVTTIARRLMAVTQSGKFRLLAAAPGDLTLHDVSPDGTAIITIDDRERKIFFSDSKDTQEKELTWLDRAVLTGLSTDGKQVLFHEGGKGGGSQGTIFLRGTDGSAAVRLGEGYSVALSPDQKWVLAFTPSNPPRDWLIPTGAGEVTELKPTGIENAVAMGFTADSRRIVFTGVEPGHQARDYLFDVASGKLQPLTPEGIQGPVTPDGKFIFVHGNGSSAELIPVDGSPIHEMKGLQEQDRLIQITTDGAEAFVANPNGLSATIYRVRLDTGERKLVKTLEMRDPTGGFGLTRALTTPAGQFFAYGTLRQLSELYVLQGLR